MTSRRRGAVAWCCAAAALLLATATIAEARDVPRVVSLKVCIDGLDNLHIRDGRLVWQHLAFEPPGTHRRCKGITEVNGIEWGDWSKPFQLPFPTQSLNIAFHPVRCRGHCGLVQRPSAANGWEAIYQLDDYGLSGPDVYCINIVIGGPRESVADQSILRDGSCSQDAVS